MPSNLGIRLTMDAGQAKSEANDLGSSIDNLRNKIKELQNAGEYKEASQLLIGLNNAVSARGQLMAQSRQAEQAAQLQAQQGSFFNSNSDVGKYLMAQSLTKLTETVISALEKGFEAAKKRAGGDYTGAAVTEMQRDAGLISGGAGLAAGVAGLIFSGGNPFVAGLASQLTEKIVGYFSGKPVHEIQENLAYSAQYKNALQGIDSLNQLYGGAINQKSADENNRYGMEMRGRAVDAARGTGLDTERFIEALGQTATYGIRDATQAMNMLKTQAVWSRFTGADLGTIQKFAGQAYRYGGETDATATAFAGLSAQNMSKGQTTEFLNSIERAMSEGISKGFVKSTEEIAGNMQMLYKMSGGSALWQGEQGAQRLSQMSSSISSATALETPAHDMVYSAVSGMLNEGGPEKRNENYKNLMRFQNLSDADKKLLSPTGTYIDNMALIERMGASGKMLGSLKEIVEGFEGDNVAAIVEWYRQFYGLNYLGGMQLYNMMEGKSYAEITSDKFEKEVKDNIIDRKEFKSDSQLLRDTLNDLQQKGIKIGQVEFPITEMKALTEAMIALEKAYTGRTGEKPLDPIPGVSEEVLRDHTNKSLPVSHSMIFNDAAIKHSTTGLDAYNQIKERYFNIIKDCDESRFLSETAGAGLLADFIPKAIMDGDFSTTGKNNDFDHATKILDDFEKEIAKLSTILQGLTNQAEALSKDGIPLNIHVDGS